ncbi:S8 family serine peptidase [Ectothiorhodospira marina]|uniref:S8 family serine peptidase n=1 Tax=Ectothiorhodospira marina TaxID=1396821 RepID=UPI00116005F0
MTSLQEGGSSAFTQFSRRTVVQGCTERPLLNGLARSISCAGNTDASYCLVSGTSMSAPMVSGAAALLWSQMDMDDLSWKRVRDASSPRHA